MDKTLLVVHIAPLEGEKFCQVAFNDPELYKKIILDRAAKDKLVLVKSDDVIEEFVKYVKRKNMICFTMSELKCTGLDLI